MITALELRKGHLIRYDGRICAVTDWSIMRNDRRQYVNLVIKDIATGRMQEMRENGDTKFEFLDNERIDLSHSYTDGIEEVFYDKEGAEYRCGVEAAKDALQWSADGYIGLMVAGQLISISPPTSVVLEVAETSPPIRGGGQSGLKDAILVNGVKVRVANLVDVGEKVRIDPLTLEFKERIAR